MSNGLNVSSRYEDKIQNMDAPIFFQEWWLQTVCQKGTWSYSIVEDNKGLVLGVLPYYCTSFFYQTMIRMPPLTPYLGVWLNPYIKFEKLVKEYSFQSKIVLNLINQLPAVCWYHQIHHPAFQNCYPFFFKGFRQTTRYTYVISQQDYSVTLKGMRHNYRRKIKKSNEIIEIKRETEVDDFLKLDALSEYRNNDDICIDLSIFRKLSKNIFLRNQGLVFNAFDKSSGNLLGSLFVVFDSQAVYLWQLRINRNALEGMSGCSLILINEAIIFAAEKGLELNFAGSMLPNVEFLNRGFGAERFTAHQLYKASNRLLYIGRELLL